MMIVNHNYDNSYDDSNDKKNNNNNDSKKNIKNIEEKLIKINI